MMDLTYNAVQNQITSMACQGYRIGIYDRAKKNMLIKEVLTKEEILNNLQWLKKENAEGKDIFISPCRNENRALILIDDVTPNRIEEMIKRGVNPACVVETSPNNYQVWISLGDEPMPVGQRKIVARVFAKEFGGDMASTDATHFGRLAGFTNKKPKYFTENGSPFALCRGWPGGHAEKSDEIRAWAKRKELDEIDSAHRVNSDGTEASNFVNNDRGVRKTRKKKLKDAGEVFCLYFQQWVDYTNFHSKPCDLSVGDFAVVCKMLKEGYPTNDIINALITHSPNIDERKANHIEDYAVRTVSAATKRCGIINT